MKPVTKSWLAILALLLASALSGAAAQYTVSITNVTQDQPIAPPVVASHSPGTRIFSAGQTASEGLELLAEDGDPSILMAELQSNSLVLDVAVAGGLLLPGETVQLSVEANGGHPLISAVGMLVSTNDAFFGLSALDVIGGRWWRFASAPAYDAGTEANAETCDAIPGPPCGSAFVSAAGTPEGYIHIHPGIQGIGDLDPTTQGWLNPVVSIEVIRTGG